MILAAAAVVLAAAGALAVATALGSRALERRHPPGGTFVDVSGGRLHLVDLRPPSGADADGPPVVLLHGASGSLEDMRMALGDHLGRRHRVILVDRPGHGWSDRGGGSGAEPARQAGLIVQGLDRLGVGKAIFVGHSWSGALVTALALAYPQRACGLVLLAPVTHPWPGGVSWYYDAAAAPVVGELLARTLVMPVGRLLLTSGVDRVFAPQSAPEDYIERAGIALLLRPTEFRANARDVTGLKAFVTAQAPHYREIAVPVTIITGDIDKTVSPAIHSRALAVALPHARLIILPGVGHMPHHAAPDIVTAEVGRMADLCRIGMLAE
jgi:pimeloyl-ACP methyl ester carboxylesterase